MYGVDGSFVLEDKDAYEVLKATIESCSAPDEFCEDGFQSLAFRVTHSNAQEPAMSHTVQFSLPDGYPVEKHAICRIEWEVGTRADHEFLNGVIEQYAESLTGGESCFQLIQVR